MASLSLTSLTTHPKVGWDESTSRCSSIESVFVISISTRAEASGSAASNAPGTDLQFLFFGLRRRMDGVGSICRPSLPAKSVELSKVYYTSKHAVAWLSACSQLGHCCTPDLICTTIISVLGDITPEARRTTHDARLSCQQRFITKEADGMVGDFVIPVLRRSLRASGTSLRAARVGRQAEAAAEAGHSRCLQGRMLHARQRFARLAAAE